MLELHVAAYNADAEAVRRLLAGGVPPDSRDESGYTPLLWGSFRAAVADQVPVIEALVEAGADPNAITGDSNCLMLAAQSGSEPAVEALVTAGAQVDAHVDGVTALMVAARAGYSQIVQRLLELGADPAIRCGRFVAADYARYGGHEGLADVIEAATRRLEGCGRGHA